jgi:hypothetical protein
MGQEKSMTMPSSYEVKDWIEATKRAMITGYIDPKLMRELQEEHPFTKADFERDLQKISRKVKR